MIFWWGSCRFYRLRISYKNLSNFGLKKARTFLSALLVVWVSCKKDLDRCKLAINCVVNGLDEALVAESVDRFG